MRPLHKRCFKENKKNVNLFYSTPFYPYFCLPFFYSWFNKCEGIDYILKIKGLPVLFFCKQNGKEKN